MFILENSGVYKIKSKIDNRYYPGSSKHLLAQKRQMGRWWQHLNLLKRNKHHCPHLQYFYNKYGEDSLEFVVIQNNIPEDQLLLEEQKLLNIAKTEPEKCFTNNFIAGRPDMSPEIRARIGQKNKGQRRTEEAKRKMSQSKLGKCFGKNNSNFGHFWTDTQKAKSSQTHKEKYKMGYVNPLKGRPYPKDKILKGKNSPNYDATIYIFQHLITKEIFKGTQCDFKIKYDFKQSTICSLIKGRNKTAKKWILIKN